MRFELGGDIGRSDGSREQVAQDIRINAPLCRASRDLYQRIKEQVGSDADHTAAVKYWERLNDMMVSEGRKPG